MSEIIYVLSLEHNSRLESRLFRIINNAKVRFIIGASLYGRSVQFSTNYSSTDECERKKYHEIPLNDESQSTEIEFSKSGSFHFKYDSDGEESGSFYIVVDPQLTVGYGDNCQTLFLNSIQCQTVLTKCLGHFDDWKQRLEVSKESGYNMLHFTPIQELGASLSSYCIKDQLKLNTMFNSSKAKTQYEINDVTNLIEWIRREWKMLSITDIVLNHTANETIWLREHPEAAYNCCNSPHLRPAYLLDRMLWRVTCDVIDGLWESFGLFVRINTEEHLSVLKRIINEEYLPMVKIHELYMVNGDEIVRDVIRETNLKKLYDKSLDLDNEEIGEIKIIQDPEYRRFKGKIDMNRALKLIQNEVPIDNDFHVWIERVCNYLKYRISQANDVIKREIEHHLSAAVGNVIHAVRYDRIQSDGPKIPMLSKRRPLVRHYFTHEGPDTNFVSEELEMYNTSKSQFLFAHNGWVMGDDPLRNFAEPGSNVYIRRELIAWGDSVKLRYGNEPKDSPFLWKVMEEYVLQMSKTFHGLRLDNCHSTPIHVAEYMIDAARRQNPNLYLIAELFTSSEHIDNVFINRLGINSLIREAMSAGDTQELGRQVYRFGGEPVGAFLNDSFPTLAHIRPLMPSIAHAIFYDVTHDNESPIVKRSPYDPLPTAALVSMTHAAIGSNRGYDELVPHQINVVTENRYYTSWNNKESEKISGTVSFKTGIIKPKRAFNDLHHYLSITDYQQAFVDIIDGSTIAVTRHNRDTHNSVVLVARTAFSNPINPNDTGYIRPLQIAGKIEFILLESQMSDTINLSDFTRSVEFINGLDNFNANLRKKLTPEESKMVTIVKYDNGTNEVFFKHFPPSSVIAFKVSLGDNHLKAITQLKSITNQFNANGEIVSIVNDLSLTDINYILFRCVSEEKFEGRGGDSYELKNIGALNYCGFAGFMSYLRNIRTHNDLGHPLCENLRDGDWLSNYIVTRLSRSDRCTIKTLSQWLEKTFGYLKLIPRYLIPRYFDAIVTPLYSLILDRVWSQLSPFVRDGSKFVQLLSLGTVALFGCLKSSSLPPLSPKLSVTNIIEPTLAAGFPHFASGYMRCWGRDTFIALKGALIITGRSEDARRTILGFAGTLRHGLIPNLLNGGLKARYNCRDAVWWWMQSIKDYCTIVPNGIAILNDPVRRLYPTDDPTPIVDDDKMFEQCLRDTIQEALEKHFKGIDFVEHNAGTQIDAHMTREGFHVCAGVNRNTGFVYGGNEWNCGTWMDKMGSSERAGNKGRPASPRDGSAVELVALCKSVINWIEELYTKKIWPYDGVTNSLEKWTWKQWNHIIQNNFESKFYISNSSTDQLINRKGIYKDSVGATHQWQDYQLRPNFLISMVVAPELFDPQNARNALEIVNKVLVGPLGVKTLDPSDLNYRGDYDGGNDSCDYHTAHGFNYHQGPEWLWPFGYYLNARLKFTLNRQSTIKEIMLLLSKHYQHLESSHWYGLPELTNSHGKHCHHSCSIQLWSHSTIIEALYSINNL